METNSNAESRSAHNTDSGSSCSLRESRSARAHGSSGNSPGFKPPCASMPGGRPPSDPRSCQVRQAVVQPRHRTECAISGAIASV